MWPRLSIVAGLLTGVVVAALVLGGLLYLSPRSVPAFTPQPSSVIASASPSIAVPSPSASSTASPGVSGSPSPSGSGSVALFHVGAPAPALVVPKVGGGTIDLAKYKGKPVWVNFMGTNCPPCQDEFPLMNGFAARYGGDGLVILAIDVKEDEAAVATFANELEASFPLGLDSDGSAAARWDAVVPPVHFWIDKAGIVRDGANGGIGSDVMARGVGKILPGVKVTP